MRLVLDANVVAAALIRPDGWTAWRFASKEDVWLFPEPGIAELEAHMDEFASRAGTTPAVLRKRLRHVLRQLTVVAGEQLRRHARHPLVVQAMPLGGKDAAYMATFVASGADFVWTRDRALLDAFPGIAVSIPP